MPDFTRRISRRQKISDTVASTIAFPLKYSHLSLHVETQRFQRAALGHHQLFEKQPSRSLARIKLRIDILVNELI